MSANGLRLRLTKTQYIWLGRRQQLAKLDLTAIACNFHNNYYFKFSVTVHDLGIQGLGAPLDQELTFALQSLHPLPMPRQLYLMFPLHSPPTNRLPTLILPLLTTSLSQLDCITDLTRYVGLLAQCLR